MFIGDIFDPFKKVYTQLKVKQTPVYTDNWLHMLHRKWSFIFSLATLFIMISYPVLVDSTHFIICFGPDRAEIPESFLKEWCYLTGTYINPEYIKGKVGKEVPHPGIGPDNPNSEKVHHTQYLFYPVIFLVQFFLFRASKYLWKHLEGGRLKNLLAGLRTAVSSTDEEVTKRIDKVADYMIHCPLPFHNGYAYAFIFCELFNAFSIIAQFGMLHFALNYEFLNFGWDAVVAYAYQSSGGKLADSNITDPFTKVFPKMTKCILPKHGPSGNVVHHEALCVLPWNNIAEKFFLFWWFWLTLLGILTVFGLLYRAVVLFSRCTRYWLLRLRTRSGGLCDSTQLRTFCQGQSYGDWFVLSLIQKNMDPWVFATLMDELDKKQIDSRRRKDF